MKKALTAATAAMLLAAAPSASAKVTKTCHAQNGMFPRICISVTPLAEAKGNPNVAISLVGASWYWMHHSMRTLTFGPVGVMATSLPYTGMNPTWNATATAPTAGAWTLTVTMNMYNGLVKHIKAFPVTIN